MRRFAGYAACLGLAVGLGLFASPAVAQTKAAIQQLADQWAAAFNRGDAAAVAAMYTKDAYVLPAGGEMVQGRAAIEALWKKDMEQLGDGKCTTIDVKPLGGSAAREIGTCTFKTKVSRRRTAPSNTPSSGRKKAVGGSWPWTSGT